MSESMQILVWGAAVAAVVGVNLYNRSDDPDAAGLSMMLLILWVLSNLLEGLYQPPDSMKIYPLMDLAAGLTAYLAWRTRKVAWKLGLAYLFVIQLAAHFSFWAPAFVAELRGFPPVTGDFSTYKIVLNVVFILQLILVGGVGVSHVASRILAAVRASPLLSRHTRA